MLKIVYFGTPEFAVAPLKTLVEAGCNIAAVVTAPDKPAGRGRQLAQSDVKQYALSVGLPILQPEKLKAPDFVEALQTLNADLFIVVAFRMMPEVVWNMPPLGTFNLHASLLPQYRGAAPINHAIINGETQTGVTTFFLKHEIDTGDIIYQEKLPIAPTENVGSLYARLMDLGATLVLKTVQAIENNTLSLTPQSHIPDSEIKLAPKLNKAFCKLNWAQSAHQLHNHIRGLSPYPAAYTTLHRPGAEPLEIKIFDALPTANPSTDAAGTVVTDNKSYLYINTTTTQLQLLLLQPAARNKMDIRGFLAGTKLPDKTTFGN